MGSYFFMEKRNSKDKAIDKDIVTNLSNMDGGIKDLAFKIVGSEKNTISTSLDNKMNSLSNELDVNCNGDIIGSLISITRDSSLEDAKKLERIKSTIKDNTDSSIMQTLLNEMGSVVAKYEDLMSITSIMPQLKDARKGIVNNILSPDDATKKVALSMSLYGTAVSGKQNKEFYTEVKDIMEEVKFTKLLKHGIDRAVTLGKYYFAVLPYDELYGEIIERNHKKNRLRESTNLLNESMLNDIIDEDILNEGFEDSKKLKESICNFVNQNVIINEDASGLFDEDVLAEELKFIQEKQQKENTKDKKDNKQGKNVAGVADFEKYALNIFKDLEKRERKGNLTGKPITKANNTNTDGFISVNSAETDEKYIPKIKGCKIKKLDPRRLIPLKIDDTCFGYYYIENRRSLKAIQNPIKYKLKDDLTRGQFDSSIDMIYKSIGELMIKKIDKKFIEKNSEIKERLYDIVKNYEDAQQQYSITFLKPDDVVEFEIDDGESPFEQSLWFSKLYMLVLMSTITARVTRANDIRAYYIDLDAKGPANNMLMNAVNTLKRQNKSIIYYNNIQKIISASTVFDDVFLGKPAEGKNPIDFDIIQGQNVDIPTDLLEMLEKIAVDSTGLPLQLIQSSNDADFAKTYSMLNIKFLKRIVDF